ncbi:tail tape measure protein [Sphingomonas ginsenosidivorax]|uniref:Tail tape measure protein n=1 Tax=Sphingomonas ginsenosidivorax TaxID=862135 RepID=A0A5C6UJD3_9SPHN|nr:tail tape measure protein [Sphingomonas ginsenosidivorax]TXC72155.1 tail tape measure protein [Sphingomonas ginsenosidivorax]
MDEDSLIGVRADTAGFARDVAAMRGELEGVLGAGAERAAARIETALLRAVRSGKIGFEELKAVALAAMDAIARRAVDAGMQSVLGGRDVGATLAGGQPGRATGGAVSPGRAYLVGERGAELFVPTSSGRVEPSGSGARDVRVTITVNASGDAAPAMLAQSSRQVARAVRAALAE